MLRFEEEEKQIARIKVVGVGGGGSNAIDHMVDAGIHGVEFAVMNTDVQALTKSVAPEKIQIGKKTTRGQGTGGDPELGRQAALDDKELIVEMLDGVDIIFITAGFGGGTGTGAAPVIAQLARDMGALTVGVVTKPFTYEGKKRMRQAEQGLKEFRDQVDTIICIPNDKLFDMVTQDTPLYEAYRLTDQILYQAVESISQVIIQPGIINLDFADIRTILSIKGGAVIGFGEGTGKNKASKALNSALASPLLETKDMRGAKGILISIVGGKDLALYEVNNAIGSIHEIADEDANIIIGAIIQDDMQDKALVTLIATGLNPVTHKQPQTHNNTHTHAVAFSAPVVDEPEPEPEETALSQDDNLDDQDFTEPHQEHDAEEIYSQPQTDDIIHQPQRDFFEQSDPTLYKGTNLDIPSFMRKKKSYATRT